MGTYDSARALSARLILKKGEPITVRRFPAGTVNAAQPWKRAAAVPGSVDQTAVPAVWLDFDGQGQAPVTYADGTQARIGDKVVLIAGSTVNPAPDLANHLLRANGETWVVKLVKKLEPNGEQVLYTLWATR